MERLIMSWEASCDLKMRETYLKQLVSSCKFISDCGGFTQSEISLLQKNQRICCGELIDNEVFLKFASALSSPYLFNVIPMISPVNLIYYARNRADRTVIECEEVIAATHTYDGDEEILNIAKHIDQHNINNVLKNAGTVLQHDSNTSILKTIEKAFQSINEKTNTYPCKWVIYPPELHSRVRTLKLTPTLSSVGNTSYKIYVSRLIPDNCILVGADKLPEQIQELGSHFNAFVFCPYILLARIEPGEATQWKSRFGSKMTRSGSAYYARIEFPLE